MSKRELKMDQLHFPIVRVFIHLLHLCSCKALWQKSALSICTFIRCYFIKIIAHMKAINMEKGRSLDVHEM